MIDYSQELRARGCKVTPQRSLILEVLRDAGAHLTAEEIAARTRVKQPSISVGTVYRNLNTLCELGIVRRIHFFDGGRRYEIDRGHHHHLICLGCSDMVEIDICPFNQEVKDIVARSGFEVAGHNFQVTGYCRKCREGGKK